MRYSQNGWPVVTSDKVDKSPINGHAYPNGFLKGDVYTAFTWLFTQLDKRVEKVSRGTPADEWGYYVKKIEGSSSISNHSSATAGDYNATLHPYGKANTYSTKQRDEIHKILIEAKGIFRWGGDYTGKKDDMHFEIVKDQKAVRGFVLSIKRLPPYKRTISLNGLALPVLNEGDKDDNKSGYNYVKRLQAMLNFAVAADLKVDGWYGAATSKEVAKLESDTNGKSVRLPEWTQLYGLGTIN